jgi:hypothetical protein
MRCNFFQDSKRDIKCYAFPKQNTNFEKCIPEPGKGLINFHCCRGLKSILGWRPERNGFYLLFKKKLFQKESN